MDQTIFQMTDPGEEKHDKVLPRILFVLVNIANDWNRLLNTGSAVEAHYGISPEGTAWDPGTKLCFQRDISHLNIPWCYPCATGRYWTAVFILLLPEDPLRVKPDATRASSKTPWVDLEMFQISPGNHINYTKMVARFIAKL